MLVKIISVIFFITPGFCYWYQDCNSAFELHNLSLSGCSGTPCPLQTGTEYEFDVNMTATMELNELREEVEIMMINIHNAIKSYPAPCSENRPCPVEKTGDASFKSKFVVPDWMPSFPGQLVWKLFNDQNESILCININIETCQNPEECKGIRG